ncbi:MAG: hypothetical protein ACI9HK_000714 [Pirellulaceae bacterium]|jgi:hypothetical protein
MNDTYVMIDVDGQEIAQVAIRDIEDGWYHGALVQDSFPVDLKRALEWYDEVVSDQMLAFVDEAVAAVDRFGLQIYLSKGKCEKVHSLNVSSNGEVAFRITPVPPPPDRD